MTEENGLSCPLRFYNMLVHLRTGSRPAEENVAVKNIWQKDIWSLWICIFTAAKSHR